MTLEKLVCPQCGSNEINVVQLTVFECQSCGTILKEEKPKEIPQPPPINKPKEKPFRSKRIQHGLDDQPDFSDDSNEHYSEQGNQVIKMIFWVGIIGGIVMLAVWLLE